MKGSLILDVKDGPVTLYLSGGLTLSGSGSIPIKNANSITSPVLR